MDRRKNADGRGEAGQMLLLTAIILAMGFIALASMTARIDQIPDEAQTIQQGLFFDEVGLVTDAVGIAMDGLVEDYGNTSLGSAGFATELDGILAHMVHVERGHGYLVDVGTVACGGSATLSVTVAVASADQEITLVVSRDYGAATC